MSKYVVNKVAKMASECLSVCIIWTLFYFTINIFERHDDIHYL